MREVRLFILPDGEIQMFVDGDLSFDEAREISLRLEDELKQAIPFFKLEGEPESHRNPDVRHVHIVQHQRVG